MRKSALIFPDPKSSQPSLNQGSQPNQGDRNTSANLYARVRPSSCADPVVGSILAGWRFDISGLSPAMATDYEEHLSECSYCRRRQRVARTIDVLLLSVSTLSILAFLLAAVVYRP